MTHLWMIETLNENGDIKWKNETSLNKSGHLWPFIDMSSLFVVCLDVTDYKAVYSISYKIYSM